MDYTKKISGLFEFIYKYRFLICIVVFIFCVFFKLHGSSIGAYEKIITGEIQADKSIIIGKNQFLRSDEFGLHTLMAFSQKHNDYKLENPYWNWSDKNMATLYNQPVKGIFSVVKPFYWGYLLTKDNEYGLSWYWCGRTIFLLLMSFEFFQILTRRKRLISLLGAALIVYSPAIQWWFAINDLVEQIFWGEVGILCLYYFLNTNKIKLKIFLSILSGLCISGFILCFYPAWQIPLAYVFVAIAIYILISEYKKEYIKKYDFIFPIISIIIASIIVLSLVIPSIDAILAIKNTVYPGQRTDFGGNYLPYLFFYLANYNIYQIFNLCELAQFLGLFPLPEILGIIYLIKNKFSDKLLIFLLVVQLFFILYLCLGFSKPVADFTLMSHTTGRAALIVSFVDVILLIRLFCLDNFKIKYKWIICTIYSFIVFFGLQLIGNMALADNPDIGADCLVDRYFTAIVMFAFCYLILKLVENDGLFKKIILSVMIILSFFTFGFINPLVSGLKTFFDNPLVKEIEKVQQEAPGKWLTFAPFPINNILSAIGAETFGTTQIYPDFKLHYLIDKDKKNIDKYNNYAHIMIIPLSEKHKESLYTLIQNVTSVIIELTYDDFKKLKPDYVLSQIKNPYSAHYNEIEFKEIYSINGTYIYKAEYKN